MRQTPTLCAAIATLCIWCSSALPATETSTLSDSARWYGFLMVDHWMIVDLTRQIDRAVYEHGSLETPEHQRLERSVLESETKLEKALTFYKDLYRTNSATGLERLANLLQDIARLDSANQRDAEALLQTIGDRMTKGGFRAAPVKKQELPPKLENAVGIDFKPKRILFGSTGTPGDERVAPLQFDFCKGVFGFYAPMSGPGELSMPEGARRRTDGAYTWMSSNYLAYHYWAGVYNNQNTYVAPWFLRQHGGQDDIWLKLADGKLYKGNGEWGQLNIWNPSVQDYIRDYCEAQAKTLHDDPFLLCYDYTAEPHPWAGQGPEPPNLPQYSGYNESAIKAFRDYLSRKFGTIGNLNKRWKSSYPGFDVIEPPDDPYVRLPKKATPLSYEFEQFRCASQTRFWKTCYDGYRKFDKTKPVVANASMYMSGWPLEGLDAWRMQKAPVADWIDMHMNNFPPNLPEQIYLYSLCRLSGKVPVIFEYIWSFPRTTPFDDNNESDFRATCQASVWRNLAWGKKAFVFFDVAYDWPAYHNAFLDRDVGYSILRPSVCAIPALKRKAVQFNEVLMNTEVVSPPMIVIQPSASILSSPRVHPNRGFSFHISVASALHNLLFPKNYSFLYVPEEAVLEDGYALKQHKVILLPEAPYLPEKMTERLLEWVRAGGTLISVGPPGIWNPYGFEDMRLISQIFGTSEVIDQKPGEWHWLWKLHGTNRSVELIKDSSGRLLAARARYGRGTALISTAAYSSGSLKETFYETINHAIGERPIRSARDSFELLLREDKKRHRYIFALNPATREIRNDEIILSQPFRRCTDLGIGSGIPLPFSREGKQTHFRLQLAPGEGTIIELKE